MKVEDFTEDITIDGPNYPFSKERQDFKHLIERALNIISVIRNIQLNKPGLVHETSRLGTLVNNELDLIYRTGDSIGKRNVLLRYIWDAEKWVEALFYNPSDIKKKD